jgi:hypothetical protein
MFSVFNSVFSKEMDLPGSGFCGVHQVKKFIEMGTMRASCIKNDLVIRLCRVKCSPITFLIITW